MVPKLTRGDSADAVAQIAAAARRSQADCVPVAQEMQACAEMFVRSWTEGGCLARGRRLMARTVRQDFGDGALKRNVVRATVDALQLHSPKFKQAWATLTRPTGLYGLPLNLTMVHLERQPEVLRQHVCPNRVVQWEREFRLQLATSGVLARLVLLRAPGLSQALLSALAAYPLGLERFVGHTLAYPAQSQADALASASLTQGKDLVPLSVDEWARWHALCALDGAQQRLGHGQPSRPVRALQALSERGESAAFTVPVRALIDAFAGMDVPACVAFYRSPTGQAWLAKQTELSYMELGKLWDAIDRHTHRIDGWIRTMA